LVDLHIHTSVSDGILSPTQVVEEAKRLGLRAIAIADHDTTSGVAEAVEAGKALGVEVVPAVEINTENNGREVHILGFFIPHGDERFEARLGEQRESRVRRIRRILEKLEGLGLPLTPEQVLRPIGKASVGRPHVAQAMVDAGYVETMDQAFYYYLGRHAPAYVPREAMSPQEAVVFIGSSSGIPVLAHPGLLDRDAWIPELVEAGLLGLEAYYTRHDERMTQRYKDKARQLGLLVTGGSDFHGWETEDMARMGVPVVEDAVFEVLKAKSALLHP
jgi:hypothetical protein